MNTKNNESDSEDMQANSTLDLRAQDLLQDPELLDRASALIGDLGLCGEDQNRRLVFLAGVGGLLGEPIHLVIKGDSSGGKNTLANMALQLLPEGAVLATSGLSPQALAYYGEGEEGKDPSIEGVLLIDEAEGLAGAEYSLRQAMSEGRVARLTVGKDESARWGGRQLSVEVTASIITTTTETALHRENQTRVFDLWIDESQKQTRDVLSLLAERAAGGGPSRDPESRRRIWREALSLLESREVVVPFARELADALPDGQLRMRRDFGRVISLIKVSALLHQRQRLRLPDGRLIAELSDYRAVYPLLQESLEPSLQGLNETALQLSDLHTELASEASSEWVKRADLEREAAKRGVATSVNTVRKWCKRLHRLGYWEGSRRGPHGAWYHRNVRDPHDEPVLLPRPEDLDRPDLPRGPNSLLGRGIDRNDKASESPPNPGSSEGSGSEAPQASECHPSSQTDWEASETPQQERERSSQPSDWEGMDPDTAEAGSRRVTISADLADGHLGD